MAGRHDFREKVEATKIFPSRVTMCLGGIIPHTPRNEWGGELGNLSLK